MPCFTPLWRHVHALSQPVQLCFDALPPLLLLHVAPVPFGLKFALQCVDSSLQKKRIDCVRIPPPLGEAAGLVLFQNSFQLMLIVFDNLAEILNEPSPPLLTVLHMCPLHIARNALQL